MIISHKHRFVFIHIHKTGGQSVATALRPFLGPDDIVVDGHLDKPSDQPGLNVGDRPLEKHSGAAEIRDAMPPELWSEYRKFSVVRDPVTRAQSLYAYVRRVKASRDMPARRIWYATVGRRQDPMTWAAMQGLVESDSFSEFIRHPATLADPAMRSQWSMLTDGAGNQIVGFVARTESLPDDFRRLTSWLGLAGEIALPHVNASQPSSGPPPVSDADREYLRDVFRADFEHLEYGSSPAGDGQPRISR